MVLFTLPILTVEWHGIAISQAEAKAAAFKPNSKPGAGIADNDHPPLHHCAICDFQYAQVVFFPTPDIPQTPGHAPAERQFRYVLACHARFGVEFPSRGPPMV